MMDHPEAKKAKTILFINLYSAMGGGEYALYNLLKHLDRSRFRPVMMFNERGEFARRVESLGIETVVLPYQVMMLRELVHPARFAQMLKSSRQIANYLKQDPAELIHCSDVLSLMFIAIPVIRFRISVVYSVIFFYEWTRILLFNFLAIILVDKIIANSSAVRKRLQARTLFLSGRMEVVYQGVDTSEFRPSRNGERDLLRGELALSGATRLVGMVGRFDPQKGHIVFLEAAAQVIQRRRDVRFVVIGGALFSDVFPFYKQYQNEVMECHRRLDLGAHVTFLPQRDDIPEVMRSLDLYVLPSTQEGFGLVVLEALASAVPVVVSDAAGAVEVVGTIPSVYVAETGNPGSFAEKILHALDDIERREGVPTGGSSIPAVSPDITALDWGGYADKMETFYAIV
ncbi:MAG TPA: glycosyltransferase family 4 protein [Bacteroidota bacterium]|jgi:glycosyltransferase involved in cell wall biosynthesis